MTDLTLLSLDEAAAQVRVSPKTFKRRAREAGINPARLGRSPIYTAADLATIVEHSRWRSNSYLPASAARTTLSAGGSRGSSLRSQQARQIRGKLTAVSKNWTGQ